MLAALTNSNLNQSRKLRISAFTLFYFAQGIPIGLLTISVPGWLSELDLSAADIASLVAIVGLPWGFKLVAAPFMDRFSFLPMGFRRPWVLGAQGGLTLAMLAMMSVVDVKSQFWLMVWIGFAINCFGALQDVAVDGMAIDLLPEDERGRANAFMAFGQVAGFSIFGALDGWLLVNHGLPATALVSAISIGVIFVFVALVREREGERLLPWTAGQATQRETQPVKSFAEILKNLFKVLLLPMSLILVAAEWLGRMGAGVGLAVFPLLGVHQLGYPSEVYSFWMSTSYAIAAFIGLFFGPLVDKYGAKPLLVLGFALSAMGLAAFAIANQLWESDEFVLTMLLWYFTTTQILFIGVIAGFMMICWNQVAATQFAVYMSLANLARSVGAAFFGLIATDLSLVESVYLMAGFYVLAAFIMLFFNLDKHKQRMAHLYVR